MVQAFAICQLIGKARKHAHNQSVALQMQAKAKKQNKGVRHNPKQQRKSQYNLLGRRLLRRVSSSPKLTQEQMPAACGSYEAKSMDERKKLIDLTEEEEEKHFGAPGPYDFLET